MTQTIDLAQAEAFITALTGSPSTTVLFQLADDTEPGDARRESLTRVIVGSVRQHHTILSRLNAMGAAIWVQVNEGRRGAANVTGLRSLFVDDDGEGDAPELKALPSIVVATSNGERNRHYYWRLKAGEPVEKFTPSQKHLIAALGTDKSINNLDRVMRLPGSFNMKRANRKGEPEPVKLLFADGGRQYTIDEVLRAHPISEAARTQIVADKQAEIFTPEAVATARRIAMWLAENEITFTQQSPISFHLKHCVFNPQHIEKMAIKVLGRGGVWGACFHSSCGGNANRWAQIKDRVGGWTSEASFARGDDVEIAARLLRDLSSDTDEPLVFEEGQLWKYAIDSGLWRVVDESGIERKITTYAGRPVGKKVLAISGGTLGGVLKCLRALAGARGFFDESPPGISFTNGFLGITPAGAAFMPHSPDHRQRVGLPFPYERTAFAPRWLRYLHECFAEDPDAAQKITVLQEFVGACLVGVATTLQKALLLVGDGANGKSVFTSTICALFPADTRAVVKPQDWGKEYYKAALAGKRVNIVSEIPDNDILSGDAFKEVISGDEVDGRQPSGRVFKFKPAAGHIFSCNRLPGTSDQSWGFWRRQLVVMFNRVFAEHEQDPHLAGFLTANEMPGIASWAAMGAERILSRTSYTLPPSDAEARTQWRLEADPVAAFVATCTEPVIAAKDWVQAQPLYACFKAWLVENGHRIMSNTAFGRRLRALRVAKHDRGDASYYAVRLTIPLPASYFLFN